MAAPDFITELGESEMWICFLNRNVCVYGTLKTTVHVSLHTRTFALFPRKYKVPPKGQYVVGIQHNINCLSTELDLSPG